MSIINPLKLDDIGYDSVFKENFNSSFSDEFSPARITTVNKNNFLLLSEFGETYAELAGKFMFDLDSALDLPTVGDWVAASYFDDNSLAIIHDILPRRSLLKRRDPGKKLDYQLIASNIDTAFIIQALDTNFNLNRLERYLVMVNESNIEPIILLSKSDLLSEIESNKIKTEIGRIRNKFKWLMFSNKSGHGISDIEKHLLSQKTYCLLGSSGVGKTTLLNTLIGEQIFEVREVREKDDKGRHTTSNRQLIVLKNGSLIIDTPGMKELGNIAIETGISETFDDIETLRRHCRFSDCSHTNEEGCAILGGIENGTINQKRYDNYIKLKKETDFYQMSYQEKRKKDKSFGKMIKQVMKNNRKK